ncbi:hypothetical protein ACFQ3B_01540 [Stackebrandtia endophytica]|nr:hypothetical protein [Stackebrandtia endophytica]
MPVSVGAATSLDINVDRWASATATAGIIAVGILGFPRHDLA